MEFEEIFGTRSSGDIVVGLEPRLTLTGHGFAALRLMRKWMVMNEASKPILTRTGHHRTLPTNPKRLARAYVDLCGDRAAVTTMDTFREAKRKLAAAVELEVLRLAEALLNDLWNPADRVRTRALQWIRPLRGLGLL
jgi:hypothetical protein